MRSLSFAYSCVGILSSPAFGNAATDPSSLLQMKIQRDEVAGNKESNDCFSKKIPCKSATTTGAPVIATIEPPMDTTTEAKPATESMVVPVPEMPEPPGPPAPPAPPLPEGPGAPFHPPVLCGSTVIPSNFKLQNLGRWQVKNPANNKDVGDWAQVNLQSSTATEFSMHLEAADNSVDTSHMRLDVLDIDGYEFVAFCGPDIAVERQGLDVEEVFDAPVKDDLLTMVSKENAAESCRVFKATEPRPFGFGCDNVQYEGDLIEDNVIFGKGKCKKWIGKKGITSTSTVGEVTRYAHPLQQDRSMSVEIDDVDSSTVIFGSDRGLGGRNFLFKATLFCVDDSQR